MGWGQDQNNDIGYRIGNVEWADKRKQAEVRRGTQHHQFLGRRLTDRALAELISDKAHQNVSTAAIKKARQRLRAQGLAATDITRKLVEARGVPYASSTDPIEAWDFPENFNIRLAFLYPNYRGTNETRIGYFIRWLDSQVELLHKRRDNPNTSMSQSAELTDIIAQYQRTATLTRDEFKELYRHQTNKVIAEATAPIAAILEANSKPRVSLKLATLEDVYSASRPSWAPLLPIESNEDVPSAAKPERVEMEHDDEFLMAREFYSGLPLMGSTNAELREFNLAFDKRKAEFVAQGKFLTIW